MCAARIDLFQLAAEGLVARQKALPCELLRDGAPAFGAPALLDVADSRGCDTDEVDAAVLIESLILDGEDRFDEVRRDFVERNLNPLFSKNREDGRVIVVVDGGGLRHVAEAADIVFLRQVGRYFIGGPNDCGRSDQQEAGKRDDCGRKNPRSALRCASSGLQEPVVHGHRPPVVAKYAPGAEINCSPRAEPVWPDPDALRYASAP